MSGRCNIRPRGRPTTSELLYTGLPADHAELAMQVAPRYTHVLANSRLGRRMLRRLLRTEVGEVRSVGFC